MASVSRLRKIEGGSPQILRLRVFDLLWLPRDVPLQMEDSRLQTVLFTWEETLDETIRETVDLNSVKLLCFGNQRE